VTTSDLRQHDFAAGSKGPKVEAAVLFAERTGRRAAIGTLSEIEEIVEGRKGTNVVRG
jgi:carbamate kinase